MGFRGRTAALTVLCAISAVACTPIATVSKTPVPISVIGPGVTPTASPTPKPTATVTVTAPTTSTPTSTAAATCPGVPLAVGITSASVTLVQQKLKVSPVTGYYGTITQAAVQKFQQDNGLEVDGQVGPLTWARIFGTPVPALPGSGTATTTPTTTTTRRTSCARRVSARVRSH